MEIKDFRWADAEHKYLIADYNHEVFGWVPYTTFAEDTDEIGHYIWEHQNEYEIEEYISREVEDAIADILQKRDSNLRATDFIFMSDYPVADRFTEEDLTEIKAYRQALRDITKNIAYPYISLPTPPVCLSNLVLSV